MKLSFPKFQLALVLVLAAVSAGVVALTYWALTPSFYFEVSMRSSTGGMAQTFYDVGRGISEADSVRRPLQHAKSTAVYRFPLPETEYKTIRFDPLDHGNAHLVINYARIVDMFGHTLRRFSLGELTVASGISASEIKDGKMLLTLGPEDNDSILIMNLGAPLTLHAAPLRRLLFTTRMFFLYFLPLVTTGILWLVLSNHLKSRYMQQRWLRVTTWVRCHPRKALLLVAAMSTVISCYPVVFCGRSFVSLNNGSMLTPVDPRSPGYRSTDLEDFKGSDTGAMLWQNVPYSFVESRSIAQYGELPLWNRFDSCGLSLLGQGLWKLGDPLHTITLIAGGAAWAWDVKFLLAKVLFCWALGLTVFASSRHLPTALLLGSSSAFLGFFSLRFDHPAFFSMCYAPCLLLCWIEITRARTTRQTAGWAAALVLASWAELNSGTVKEGYMLLLSMHGYGAFIFLFAGRLKERWKLTHIAIMGTVFCFIAAPIILTFWHTLRNSFTPYQEGVNAWQIQPGMLVGLFDEIFYRAVNPGQGVYNPSANFFVPLGCSFAVVYLRSLLRDRFFAAAGLGTLFFLALVFGVVPPRLICLIPIVNHVWHVDTVFSCPLIIELFVIAGFGFRAYWERVARKSWRLDYILAILCLFVVLGGYLGLTQALQREPDEFSPLGQGVSRGSFFYIYTLSLIAAVLLLPYLHRMAVLQPRFNALVIPLVFLCFVSLHWRHGFHIKTGMAQIDDYVVNPSLRTDLSPPSAAVTFIKSQPGLFRTVGFGSNLFSGYNGIVGLESIYGTDPLLNPYYRELLLGTGVKLQWSWLWVVEKANLVTTIPLYNLLNVRYFLDAPHQPAGSVASLTSLASLDVNVYNNSTVWPRAFFVDEVRTYGTVGQFLEMIREDPGHPLAAMQRDDVSAASVQATTVPGSPNGNRMVPGRDYRLTNNTTTFVVDAPASGVAVLTEAYQAGDFIVRVNGRRSDYFRVNHAFRGVKIPTAGTYVISFSYWPRYFGISLWMAAAGAALLAGWLILALRKKDGGAALAGQRAHG
jgi:hypothetical protein